MAMTKVTQKKEAAMPSVKRQWPIEESVIFSSNSSRKAMKTKKDDGIAASRMVFILWGLAGLGCVGSPPTGARLAQVRVDSKRNCAKSLRAEWGHAVALSPLL